MIKNISFAVLMLGLFTSRLYADVVDAAYNSPSAAAAIAKEGAGAKQKTTNPAEGPDSGPLQTHGGEKVLPPDNAPVKNNPDIGNE